MTLKAQAQASKGASDTAPSISRYFVIILRSKDNCFLPPSTGSRLEARIPLNRRTHIVTVHFVLSTRESWLDRLALLRLFEARGGWIA